jgi:hypothetical protein
MTWKDKVGRFLDDVFDFGDKVIDLVEDAVTTGVHVHRSDPRDTITTASEKLQGQLERLSITALQPEDALSSASLVKAVYDHSETPLPKLNECDLAAVEDVYWIPRELEGVVNYRPSWLGVIVRRKNAIVVALRGTADAFDWFTNVAGLMLTEGPGFVNSAYKDYASFVAVRVASYIQSNPGVSEVTLTGHSMGGAIASIVYAMLYKQLPSQPNIRVITFGAPAVGAVFLDCVASTFRIRRITDFVPHSLGDETHTGQDCLLTEDGFLIALDNTVGAWCVQLLERCKIIARCEGYDCPALISHLWILQMSLKDADFTATRDIEPFKNPPTTDGTRAEHAIEAYISALTCRVHRRARTKTHGLTLV